LGGRPIIEINEGIAINGSRQDRKIGSYFVYVNHKLSIITSSHPPPIFGAGQLSPDFKHRVKRVRGVLYFIIFQDNMKYYFQIKIKKLFFNKNSFKLLSLCILL
jgi:hypothetical protein